METSLPIKKEPVCKPTLMTSSEAEAAPSTMAEKKARIIIDEPTIDVDPPAILQL